MECFSFDYCLGYIQGLMEIIEGRQKKPYEVVLFTSQGASAFNTSGINVDIIVKLYQMAERIAKKNGLEFYIGEINHLLGCIKDIDKFKNGTKISEAYILTLGAIKWRYELIRRDKSLGNRIVVARDFTKISQDDLATKVGVDIDTVKKWETNELVPNEDMIYKIAEATRMTFAFFTCDEL